VSYDCVCWKTYTCLRCERIARGEAVKVRPPRAVSTIRKVAECGTRAGYNKHLREKTPTCEACKRAQSEYTNEIQKRKRVS
jgi:hypothetical protein